ncbi:hypothetical protein PHPALM_29628 [Phytophthora palmivora]|uniref:BZIP domain-containing protein n=1 Tax=Phytophthora palmivora TaxID=4796 RepID=A0A2P4X755_9STRA|nr:hypothetical protein PHPALM_29628 [Phytophthora palmivora]
MQANNFQPPHLQMLRENVIGNVAQRSRVHRANYAHFQQSQHVEFQPCFDSQPCLNVEEVEDQLCRSARNCRPVSTGGGYSSSRNLNNSRRSSFQSPGSKMLSYAEQMRANIEAYHRERRRKNQERYRAKQRQMVEDLQVNNHKLQEELQQLQRTRDMLSVSSIKAKETVWYVAVEYFRVFRRGLLSTEDTDLLELDFLKATMAPDLDAGTVRGLESLARNWKAFTQFFQDVQIRLGRLDEVAENSLVASTTTSITITRHSLSCMFPHLISDGHEGAEWSHIASRMLNQRLVMRGSVHLNWDSDSNRVISLITQADMLSPVLQLLGNLEDVSLTFANALISPDCNLVETKYLTIPRQRTITRSSGYSIGNTVITKINVQLSEEKQLDSNNGDHSTTATRTTKISPVFGRKRSLPKSEADAIEIIQKKIKLHRERCRISQQLYRKRQQKLMRDLEGNNQQLREEIEGLSRQLYILSSEISKRLLCGLLQWSTFVFFIEGCSLVAECGVLNWSF